MVGPNKTKIYTRNTNGRLKEVLNAFGRLILYCPVFSYSLMVDNRTIDSNKPPIGYRGRNRVYLHHVKA